MVDHDDIASRVAGQIEEARERINSVSEGHKRWNRLEEALEAVCEGAIELLDSIGRYDQADEIQSHMAAHERFDFLFEVFAREGDALRDESAAAGLGDDFTFHQELLKAMHVVAAEERHHRPRG